jgi:hypothetical protein
MISPWEVMQKIIPGTDWLDFYEKFDVVGLLFFTICYMTTYHLMLKRLLWSTQ